MQVTIVKVNASCFLKQLAFTFRQAKYRKLPMVIVGNLRSEQITVIRPKSLICGSFR